MDSLLNSEFQYFMPSMPQPVASVGFESRRDEYEISDPDHYLLSISLEHNFSRTASLRLRKKIAYTSVA